ncbi:hypothetical protein X943_003722 [Babesia divergens]|uniref:Glutaredoxin domain-containing protein n=1 Tax=Babesia divergens TaxID=32595 RepID=A0AAD9GDP7_BABDI|nr:hypothetical protein X943_003722 [Babesia divergens]
MQIFTILPWEIFVFIHFLVFYIAMMILLLCTHAFKNTLLQSLSLAPEAEARVSVIKREISEYDVVLFMKGNASKPACKFSRQALDILKTSKVPIIRTVDVLESQELRSGIKIFSNYPYIPQLYVRKTFIGGLEKILDMYNDGSLHKLLQG